MTTVQGMLQGPYHFSTMVEVNGQTFVQLHKMPLKWPLIQSGSTWSFPCAHFRQIARYITTEDSLFIH